MDKRKVLMEKILPKIKDFTSNILHMAEKIRLVIRAKVMSKVKDLIADYKTKQRDKREFQSTLKKIQHNEYNNELVRATARQARVDARASVKEKASKGGRGGALSTISKQASAVGNLLGPPPVQVETPKQVKVKKKKEEVVKPRTLNEVLYGG